MERYYQSYQLVNMSNECRFVSLFFMRGAYCYTFPPKPMDRSSARSFPRPIRRKETLSSVDADEGRHSAILTSQTIFITFNFYRCRTSEASLENSGSSIP
jgi:hypothetical protein